MEGGNFTPVAARRIDCRRIRDRVDGGDKEEQANQPCGTLEFQNALKPKETVILSTVSFQYPHILHLI
jgi:hypothetical protein